MFTWGIYAADFPQRIQTENLQRFIVAAKWVIFKKSHSHEMEKSPHINWPAARILNWQHATLSLKRCRFVTDFPHWVLLQTFPSPFNADFAADYPDIRSKLCKYRETTKPPTILASTATPMATCLSGLQRHMGHGILSEGQRGPETCSHGSAEGSIVFGFVFFCLFYAALSAGESTSKAPLFGPDLLLWISLRTTSELLRKISAMCEHTLTMYIVNIL